MLYPEARWIITKISLKTVSQNKFHQQRSWPIVSFVVDFDVVPVPQLTNPLGRWELDFGKLLEQSPRLKLQNSERESDDKMARVAYNQNQY